MERVKVMKIKDFQPFMPISYKMKKICLIALIIFFLPGVYAATYYVDTNGNNANSGTAEQPWMTIQHAANTMVAGDTVIIAPGVYTDSITTQTDGTSGARITFQGQPGAVIEAQFSIDHAYTTLSNLAFTNCPGAYAPCIAVEDGADFCEIVSNDIYEFSGRGIQFDLQDGVQTSPTNCRIANNHLHGNTEAALYMLLGGVDTIIEYNEFGPGLLYEDTMRIWGERPIVRNNHIHDVVSSGGHTDVFQSFDSHGILRDLIFEQNLIQNFDGQAWFITGITGAARVTIRNNKFINVEAAGQSYIDDTHVYNNVFVDSGYGNCRAVMIRAEPGGRGLGRNGRVFNNIFYNCGCIPDTTGITGYYTAIGGAEDTFEADYNMVFPEKGFFSEDPGINGENPLFINPSTHDFHLQLTSPAIDAGTVLSGFAYDYDGTSRPRGLGWDIGAYEYTGSSPQSCTGLGYFCCDSCGFSAHSQYDDDCPGQVCCEECMTVGDIHYVRSSATGNDDGSDWTNAWNELPETLERGHTYYIADGNYPGYTFDDSEQGDEYIYIKKATADDHGTDDGWQDSYGDGVAEFIASAGTWNIDTGYWIFDGQSRTTGTSGYGFRVFASSQNTDAKVVDIDGDYINIIFTEIESWGYSADDNADAVYSVASSPAWNNNIYIGYCWVHNVNRQPFYFYRTSEVILEHNWVTEHYNEDAYAVHSSCMSINYCGLNANYIIRNNVFRNMEGTTCIGPKDSIQSGFKIYGNIFFNDVDHALDGYVSGTAPSVSDFDFTNGVISDTGGDTITDVQIYNNDFIDLEGTTGLRLDVCTDAVAKNNLWVNSGNPGFICRLSGSWEVGSNTLDGPTTVFADYHNSDFVLSAALAGELLDSEFDKDPDDNTRGADGVWDRGAYEFTGSGCTPVHPADTDCVTGISLAELIAYIDHWKAGDVTLQNVMGAIVIWKG